MRVKPEALEGDSVVIEEIKKDEWLQNLTEVGWAHESGYGPVAIAAGAMNDAPMRMPWDGNL
jgi:hypothetical protein